MYDEHAENFAQRFDALSSADQVSGLQAGQIYRLRVSAVNEAGAGAPSLPSEPIVALTSPGQCHETPSIHYGVFFCFFFTLQPNRFDQIKTKTFDFNCYSRNILLERL